MSNYTPSKRLVHAAAFLGLLAGCATVDPAVGWNIPAAGSSWQISQSNSGSYGKDVTYQVTRGAGDWQGAPAVMLTNSANGATVMARPDGKWMAITGRDGKTLVSYDPPIGYEYPLSVGKAWSTKHKMTSATGSITEINYSCRVEAREQVTVPAGTFDTLKIVCESPGSRDVSWTIPKLGMHAKQEFERFASHPQGWGTQKAQLVSVNLRP